MARDMTRGNLVCTLISFSLPLICSGLLQQLYSWADAFIVGNVEGELSLAAIGATTTISNLFIMIITGFTLGLSILSAQQYGQGNNECVQKILSTFAVLFGGVFLLIGIMGIWAAGPVLLMLHTPADIFAIAQAYLQIILIGIPFIAVYNVYCAILRGLGDSKAPFFSVLLSSVANVLLDILFVGVLRFGVAGAAVATLLAQILMSIYLIVYTRRTYASLRIHWRRRPVDRNVLYQGLRFGLPPAIQSSITSVGSIALQHFMNGFGTQTVAAITTAYRVDSVIMLPIINLSAGISTIVAQNAGAGNQRRANKAFAVGTIMMAVISLLLCVLIIPTGGSLIAIFGVSEAATRIGRDFFRAIACFYPVFGLSMAARGFLEGEGDMMYSCVARIASLGVRIALSYALVSFWSNQVIAYAEALSWVLLLLLYLPRVYFVYKKLLATPSQMSDGRQSSPAGE